jgi:hypothetical protein
VSSKENMVDGLRFEDDDGEVVIFNFKTWVNVIKAIIVKYTNKSEEEAERLVMSSSLVNKPISNYIGVTLRSHETEYHWAMLIAYGERYWDKGISSDEPDGYSEWEYKYRELHQLAKESFEFDD